MLHHPHLRYSDGHVADRVGLAPGGSDYPYPFNQFVNVIEVFVFDFFTFFHTECVARTTYDEKLMVSLLTMAAFGLIAVLIST